MQTSDFLRHVREHRHFKVDDVAAFTKISANRLAAFEEGARQPTFRQLEILAKAYGVPVYLLHSRTLPNLPEPLPDYRRQVPGPAQLTPAGMRRVWNAEQTATFTRQLFIELNNSGLFRKHRDFPNSTTKKSAQEFRCAFDYWFNRKEKGLEISGPIEQRFLIALRLYIESSGIITASNTAPPEDYSGFYIFPDFGVPYVFINRDIMSRKAQLFTMVHELGHHILGHSGISDPFSASNSVERTCNQFAAEFLAPLDQFQKLVEKQGRTLRSDTPGFVRSISRLSLLSMQATAIRLREAEYISRDQLRSWLLMTRRSPKAEKEEEAEAAGNVMGRPHAKRIGEIGYLPTYLAGAAIKAKLVDSIDVQFALGLSESLQSQAFSLASRRIEVAAKE